jgi:hypothetical protein
MSTLATGEKLSSHPAYKVDDRFETANGTLYVSKPYRSRTSKRLRALISFSPRNSAFDINNESSKKNEFRVRSTIIFFILLTNLTFYLSGFLHSLLDVFIHLYSSKLRAQHRSTRASSQPPLCDHVFARRYHTCFKRWCSCSQHRSLRPLCKGSEEWMVTILLDWRSHTTPTADYDTLWCHLLDFQPVGMPFTLTSPYLNADLAQELAMGSIRIFNTSFSSMLSCFRYNHLRS